MRLRCDALSSFMSMSCYSPISIKSPFLPSKIWRNLLSSSIVSVTILSLVAFSALSCSYISCWIFKLAELFRLASLTLFFHALLQIKHLLPFLSLRQFCIMSLLHGIIQLLLQIFCMDLYCFALEGNNSYCVIFDLFSDIIYFGLCSQVCMYIVSL